MPLFARPRRHIDLRRTLLARITLFAGLLFLAAVAVILVQARERVAANIERTGSTIRQLIADEASRRTGSFSRSAVDIDLATVQGLGRLVHFCAEVIDIYRRPVVRHCFSEPGEPPRLLRWAMGELIGPEVAYRGVIGQYPGIKIGELTITPDLDSEAADAWEQIRAVAWIAGGILLLNFLLYVPVHRALQPTERILATLGDMEKGDLSVRLPRFELIELERIATVFNHLAERLQATMAEQKRLAERLLEVREEERRHLARELHDEFGQCLASINAEAAYANELARDGLPDLLPCTEAMARTAGRMMDSLQQILRQLRPVGLEEFGLAAGLEQLVAGWRRTRHGQCEFELSIAGRFDDLPDNLVVSLYRIVQESLTNAAKHGQPARVAVSLARHADHIELTVEDDGSQGAAVAREGGLGVLGMHERVHALGGSFALTPRQPRGMRVAVRIPVAAPGEARHG